MNHPEIASVQKSLYIGGAWRNAEQGATLTVLDPATENPLCEVASASVKDALDAVEAAYDAGSAWAQVAPRRRGEILRAAFELIIDRKDALARLITLESGKALPEAHGEVAYAAEFLRWYSEEAVRIIGDISMAPGGGRRIVVTHQPIGLALLVTPWNFPAAMATRKIGPALAAGCTVVLKPASETPLTALALAQIFEEAGVPPGVANVVPSRQSSTVVAAMLKDVRVRKLSFTGSTETGRVLLGQAAENIVKCSMELGGNAPFIVLEDADIDLAVQSALVAKLRNGGESCTAANRFYVHAAREEEFADKLAGAMAAFRMGSGLEPGVELGPLVNRATLNKVSSLVEQAVRDGARVLTGGQARPGKGYFYPPTVLTNVHAGSDILHQEIFGPVAPICRFDHDEDAIRLANGTPFGLVAFVHSADLKKAMTMADRLEAGMVGINRGMVSDPAAPFGGWKQSGLGREGGKQGILEYLESKYVCADW